MSVNSSKKKAPEAVELQLVDIKVDERSVQVYSLLANSTMEHEKEITDTLRMYGYLENSLECTKVSTLIKDTLMIIPRSAVVGLSFLSTNFLTGLGYFVLNRRRDYRTQAAFGIYLMLRSQLYFTVILGIVLKMTISVSQCLGQRMNTKLASKFFTQSVILWVAYLVCFYIPFILCSGFILPWIGFSTELAHDYSVMAVKNLPNDIVFAAHILLMEFCFAQNIEGIFTIMSWILLPLCFALCLVLTEVVHLGFEAWILTRFTFFLFSFIGSLWIYLTKTSRYSRGFCSWREAWQDFPEFVGEAFFFAVSNLFEWIGWDVGTYFNTINKNTNQIAAYGSASDVMTFMLDGGLGFQVIGRTTVNYLIGAGMTKAAKRFAFMVMAAALITGITIGGTIFATKKYIGQYYAGNNKEEYSIFLQLLTIYSIALNNDLLYAFLSTLMRSVNHAIFWTSTWTFFGIICNAVSCWYIRNHIGGTSSRYFGSTYAFLNLTSLIGIIKLAIFDWGQIILTEGLLIVSPKSRASPRLQSPLKRLQDSNHKFSGFLDASPQKTVT